MIGSLFPASIHPTAKRLILARGLRSISQGIAVVDLTLYLKTLQWSAPAIGSVLTAASLFGAALILFVGPASDRLGRKGFLLAYETMTILAAALSAITANPVVLSIVIIAAGFGRGQSGAAGPFSPAEQAWLASVVRREDRGFVFSLNNAVGFFGMAIGAVLAGMTPLWHEQLPGAASYRPLFAIMGFISILCWLVIFSTPRDTQTSREETAAAPKPDRIQEREIRSQENTSLLKLCAVNAINGLAVGMTGPLIAYWFSLRFGASSTQIGLTLALSFIFTGISSLLTGAISQRFGMVRSVVWLRTIGTVLMVLLPIVPSFWLASAIYVVRSGLNRGTQGARSALSTSLTRDSRRGFAVSMNALSMRLPSSVGPTISGYMLGAGALALPFWVTAGLQMVYVVLYGRIFSKYDRGDRAPTVQSAETGTTQISNRS